MNCFEDVVWQKIGSKKPAGVSEKLIASIKEGAKVLDIGCASGDTAELIDNSVEYYGLDKSEKLIKQAKYKRLKAKFFVGDAENINFADESFDYILSECTLSLCNTEKTANEINRLLKPKGMLLISDVYYDLRLINRFVNQGFKLVFFEEQKEAWKQFVLQLIWEGIEIENKQNGDLSYFIAILQKEKRICKKN